MRLAADAAEELLPPDAPAEGARRMPAEL